MFPVHSWTFITLHRIITNLRFRYEVTYFRDNSLLEVIVKYVEFRKMQWCSKYAVENMLYIYAVYIEILIFAKNN